MTRLGSLLLMLKVGVREALAYRAELFVWLLTTNMPIIMLLFWSAIAAEAPVGAYTQQGFVAYFLAVLVVRLLTGSWVMWQMQMEIRQGKFNQRLLLPMSPLVSYAVENVSVYPVRLIFLAPIVALFVWKSEPPAGTAVALLGAIPAILLAWGTAFMAMAAMGAVAMTWERATSLFDVWLGLYFAASGYLVPLDLFPGWLRTVVDWLPFRCLVSLPAEVLLGKRQGWELLLTYAQQASWLLAFGLLAQLSWRRGLKRWVALGG